MFVVQLTVALVLVTPPVVIPEIVSDGGGGFVLPVELTTPAQPELQKAKAEIISKITHFGRCEPF